MCDKNCDGECEAGGCNNNPNRFKVGDEWITRAGNLVKIDKINTYTLVGDDGCHRWIKSGKRYANHEIAGSDLMKRKGVTPLPLYSEEQAASFLREKGYEVTPPPEPLKGKTVVYKLNDSIYSTELDKWEKSNDHYKKNRTVLAIVDWTEGQGI